MPRRYMTLPSTAYHVQDLDVWLPYRCYRFHVPNILIDDMLSLGVHYYEPPLALPPKVVFIVR